MYELNLEESSGEVYTSNFNISDYRQVEIPVSAKNITKTMGFYNENGVLIEDSLLIRNRVSPDASQWDALGGNIAVDMNDQAPRLVVYKISTVLDQKDGITRFSPKEKVIRLKGPKGEFYPVNKEPVKNSLLNKTSEYDNGLEQNSTIEFLIPAKNYTMGEYTAKFKSNTTNKTYGRTSFELVKEKPKLEFSNPEIKFKEDPWTVDDPTGWSMKERENLPDDMRVLELYVKHLELDVENLGELTGSITDFKYKREDMASFESWDTKGKNPNEVEDKNPKDISAMEQETVKLPFGQSNVRWDEYNGPVTILIETGTEKTFKITGELSEPVYKCEKRNIFLFSLPDCELEEEAEFSDTEITREK